MLQEKNEPGTETRDQLEDQRPLHLNSTEDGLCGVDNTNDSSNKSAEVESEHNGTDLSPTSDDHVLRVIATAAERDSLEQIDRLVRELQEYEAKNQNLKAEFKRNSLPQDKQKCFGECGADGASETVEDHQQQSSK